MKRFISILMTLAMVVSFIPATVVFATDEVAYAGIKIEYPTATKGSKQPSGVYSDSGTPSAEIIYENSSERVELLDGTIGNVVWRRGSLSFFAYTPGVYGAYKIRVPKAGKYDITVQYRADSVGCTGEMYILPISAKDNIASETENRTPDTTVNFAGTLLAATEPFASSAPFEWTAPQAGEYIVVWKAVGFEKDKRMNPANLIFDGKGDDSVPLTANSSLSKATLNLSSGESTTISTTSVTMSDLTAGGDADIVSLTYESSDESVVTVSGNVVTAVGEGTATIYTKNGEFILDEDKVKVSNLVYSGVYATYPSFIGDGGYAAGALSGPLEISYATSGWRIEWFDYNGTWNKTSAPTWNASVSNMFLNKGEYGAYKINIPEKGFYDMTVSYLARTAGTVADMYILPGNVEKGKISEALEGAEPILTGVDFSPAGNGVPDKTFCDIKSSFYAENSGEYIVVWVCTAAGGGTVRPANIILDGGNDLAVNYVDFKVSATLKPNITLYLSDGSMTSGSAAAITYASSDENILKVDNEAGKLIGVGAGEVTVTANIVYNGKTYKEETVKTLTGEETLPYSGAAKTYMFNKKSTDWQQTIIDEGEVEAKSNDVRNITYEYTDNNYSWYGTTENKYNAAYCYATETAPDGRMRMYRAAGGWTGFRIMVPARGRYAVHMEYVKYYNGEGPSDVYLIPASVPPENAADYFNEDYYLATINTLDKNATELVLDDAWVNEVNIPAAGEYAIIFRAKTKCYTTVRSLTLDGVEGMKRTELTAEKDSLNVGESVETSVRAFLLDGTEIPSDEFSVVYATEHPNIATVSETGVITGVYEGVATIKATIRYGNDIAKTSFSVTISDNSGVADVSIKTFSEELYTGAKTKLTISADMNSGNRLSVGHENARFEIDSEPEGILAVEDGCLVAKGEGKAQVKAIVNFKGETKESNVLSFDIKVGTQKSRTTIYTDEMRKTALENVKNYEWGRQLAKSMTASADKFIDNLDAIYDMIEPDNLPRSMTVALLDDPNAYSCIYCGVDIRDKYGSYHWKVNPITQPWKIQCPDCKRLFPSNKFKSFYELGKDQYGKFDLARARQLHHEMLYHKDGTECTHDAPTEEYTDEWYEFYGYGAEGGYLYNDLYGEVGKELGVPENEVGRWAVDDGWGYATGEVASTGIPIRKAYIAFYNFSLWSYGSPVQYIPDALDTIRDAYLYTGDEKYGRAGAILTDRIADVFPTYEWEPYVEFQHSHGGKNSGKIDGSIWGRNQAENFAKAYDAFWPMMDDEWVIAYLSEKAVKFGLENEKLSAEMIRKNCDDGICRESFKAAKEAKIMGNFGSHQNAISVVAITLDSKPETQEMIEWLCAPSVTTTKRITKYGKRFSIVDSNSGGEMLPRFMDGVNRDGFGAEVSVVYNQGWFVNIQEIAELYYNYDKDCALNFYNNPKFKKMFYAIFKMTMAGGYTLQVGDQYSTASTNNLTDRATALMGYLRYGDPVLAQQFYEVAKNRSSIYVINAFEKRSGTVDKEVEDLISEIGELELSSENLAAYGLAVLRAGQKIKGSNEKNLKRDAWLWYGKSETSHGHLDILQMGIDAYGFNFTPDLGYPAATQADPNRLQWVKNTLSHNTVVVDGVQQDYVKAGTPLHFDDAGKVKLVDVESPESYAAADIYRRTLVSVEASNEVDYTVDFFRVRGGKEHIYSFHTQSFKGVTADGLNLVAQNGGTYAGEDTEYGWDPNTDPNTASGYTYETLYPRGYTWLRNVQRDNAPENEQFSVNFKQTDFNKQVSDSSGLNLKWTALNDWTPSSVGIATAEPPHLAQNKNVPELDYMLVHRKGESSLDTLFTSVIQPYNGAEYIESMDSVLLSVSGGTEGEDDIAKAIKVKLKTGRCDYIVYATNNSVTYTLTDGDVSFNFRGFVGVYSVNEQGENIYSYITDGDIIGDVETVASVSGIVIDFEKDLVAENFIKVTLDREIDSEALAGRYIYIDNAGEESGAYRIEKANVDGNVATLNIGDVTLIDEYRDENNLELGYVYNIAENDKFVIPLSAASETAPVFENVGDKWSTSAGSTIEIPVIATSPVSESVNYVGTHVPRGAGIDSASGVVTWKPTASQVGVHTFVITARDASGRENNTSFEVTVYGSTTGGTQKPTTPSEPETPATPSTSAGGGGGGGGGAAPAPSTPAEPEKESDVGEDIILPPAESTEKFIDLGAHDWAKDAINALADAGIIKGTSENTFSPALNITRADFAILLVRAFNKTSDETENFSDVNNSDYFARELAIARNTGIVDGIGDNKFAPHANIKRCDMMVMVYRVLKTNGIEFEIKDVDFADFDSVPEYAKEAVSALVCAGLINGKLGRIAPNDYTTRAETAVLIKRILDFVSK